MMEVNPVKIVKAEEPGEPEPAEPERIGNPGIEVIVIRGRRIVGNDGRTLLVIIIVDYRWFIVCGIVFWR